jgi:hypothetical protein
VLDSQIADGSDQGDGSENVIIVTGSDPAKHLLSPRDDGEPVLTFRSLFLATVLFGFQAVMSQHNVSYDMLIPCVWASAVPMHGAHPNVQQLHRLTSVQFKPTYISIQGTFVVIIAYFLGKAWATFLPRGDRYEARWRDRGGQGTPPRWIRIISFLNAGAWNLRTCDMRNYSDVRLQRV